MKIGFYHLTSSPLEKALPKLLEKAYGAGFRILVLCGTEERVQALNTALWTYHPTSFLPHGTPREGFAPEQPIWITTEAENPNQSNVLVMLDETELFGDFERVLLLFDGNDPEAVARARKRWTDYKNLGYNLTYWFQDEKGNWSEK